MKLHSREEIRESLDRISAENCEKIEKHLLSGQEVEIEYVYGHAEDREVDSVCFQGANVETIEAAKKFYKSNRIQKIHYMSL